MGCSIIAARMGQHASSFRFTKMPLFRNKEAHVRLGPLSILLWRQAPCSLTVATVSVLVSQASSLTQLIPQTSAFLSRIPRIFFFFFRLCFK